MLILGLAYKKDIDDPRESPAFEIIHLLLHLGAEVAYHDPHIPVAPRMRSWPSLPADDVAALTATSSPPGRRVHRHRPFRDRLQGCCEPRPGCHRCPRHLSWGSSQRDQGVREHRA